MLSLLHALGLWSRDCSLSGGLESPLIPAISPSIPLLFPLASPLHRQPLLWKRVVKARGGVLLPAAERECSGVLNSQVVLAWDCHSVPGPRERASLPRASWHCRGRGSSQ